MEAEELRKWLQKEKLLTDGAMGTYFASLCGEETAAAEWANKTAPELIRQIHREYLQAGAVLLKTNTFGLNKTLMEITGAQVRELASLACAHARAAIREERQAGRTLPAFIAADIGPAPLSGELSEEEMLSQYTELCDIFLEEGITVFWFETFSDSSLPEKAAAYIKSRCKDAFILASFSLNKNGYTLFGKRADKLLSSLEENEDIDAAGFNCGIGPGHMKRIFSALSGKFPTLSRKYRIAAPNAGYPRQQDSRMAFTDNAAYFAENIGQLSALGADILGACCGSTPEYVRKSAAELAKRKTGSIWQPPITAAEPANRETGSVWQPPITAAELAKRKTGNGWQPPITAAEPVKEKSEAILRPKRSAFFERLQDGEKVIAVELDPPYDADSTKIMDCGRRLLSCGADILTFADSPMGRSRADSVLMAVKLKQAFGVQVMPHICCRDKNVIALRSLLLGAYIHDIRDLLLVTGDPLPGESRKAATGVFDYNSVQLMRYVKEMNEEHFAGDPFTFGGALNYAGANVDAVIKRMEEKLDAGASYFLTQPVFAEEDIARVAYLKEKTGARILCGIMPPVSYRNAVFVKNEIAGIHVPEEVVARYRADMDKDEAEQAGARLAAELMFKMKDVADGYYFMLPFNRVSLLEKVLSDGKEMGR